MPRKGEVPKRKPLPDPKFTDQPVDTRRRVTKFVNTVMHSGKKAIAERTERSTSSPRRRRTIR
jgi:small subunit ribosomal protein S7